MQVNTKLPTLTPSLSIKIPPNNGRIIFGKEYTLYKRLY